MADNKSVAFCVCEFLACDRNEYNIQSSCRSLSEWKDDNMIQSKVNALLAMLTKYKKFVHLKQLFIAVLTSYMTFDDLSTQLQEFSHFCNNCNSESFPKASQKYQDEQKIFQKMEEPMRQLANLKDSCAFKKLWNLYRKEMKEQKKLTFETSMDELYNQVNKRWRELRQTMEKESSSMEDLKWFEASELSLELQFLFPNWPPERRESVAKSIDEKREKIKRLEKMIVPWAKLKEATETLKKYHKSNHTIKNDNNWNRFVKSLENSSKVLKEQEPSIQRLSQCYDECASCFGNEALQCVELLDLIVKYEKTLIEQLATSDNFANKEHFANTLETLDNCKDIRFQQLVSALRAVNGNIQEYIWDANLQETSQVARAILAIHRRDNEFTIRFKKCCDEDLGRISFLVEEAGQMQAVQSFSLLEKAQKIGQWNFAGCDQVLQVNSNVIDSNEEKKQRNEWLVLQIGADKLNYDQIEQAIDRVLLGFSKEKQLKGVESLIKQFGTCKDIETLRVMFWRKGGRQATDKLYLSVKESLEVFKNLQSEWKQRLEEWQSECVKLRAEYPILNYFTFNEVRFLSKKLNDIVSCDPNHREILCSKFILPFLQRIDSHLSSALPYVEKWKFEAVEENKILIQFGTVFSEIWINLKNHSDVYRNTSSYELEYSKPNLIIQNANTMLSVLDLFKCVGIIPRIEHILICKENTTEEEIECLLFRAITSANRIHEERVNLHSPLYCLMWPEMLPLETLERVTKLFHTLLLSGEALDKLKKIPYLLVVMSTSPNSMLSQKLNRFRLSQRIGMNDQTRNLLIQQLYANRNSNNKPFVQLYVSDEIGMGKSFKIEQDIASIREVNSKIQAVRVAFNSSDIDWKSIMEGFWRYHPCTNEEQVQENLIDIEKKMY
ncbi:ATPase [Reticulomyxa filosa]|uniref:ATPase n=1 Tax=Reticulomyxa filosa TaxID=46433 RepID=X6LVK4_RETFI|nr:ATPase [Reticulomyxa filosa]|eukprot:ETO05187.1 ATPase [Reticulomyxa filosa]